MKIVHLLSGPDVALSNQEQQFAKKYNHVKINSLSEHEQWLAQNLVRKGIYTISKDNETLIKRLDENK
jgi:hypothetical protein